MTIILHNHSTVRKRHALWQERIKPTLRFDPVADRYNHIQVIVGDLTLELTITLDFGYQRFFDSSFGLQFSVSDNIIILRKKGVRQISRYRKRILGIERAKLLNSAKNSRN